MSRNQIAEMYGTDEHCASNARDIAKINADAAILYTYKKLDIEQSKQAKLADRIVKNMLKIKDKQQLVCSTPDGFIVCPYANAVGANGVAYNENTGLLQLAYKSSSVNDNVFTKPVKFLTRSEINAKLNPEVIETTMLEISKANSNYWDRRFRRETSKYTPNRFDKIIEEICDSVKLVGTTYWGSQKITELYNANPDAYEIFSKTPAIVYLIMEQMLGTKVNTVINHMPHVNNPYERDDIKTVVDMVKFIEAQELSEFDICGKDVYGNRRPIKDTIYAVQSGYLSALLLFADMSEFEGIKYKPSRDNGFSITPASGPYMLTSIKVPTVDSLLSLKTAIDSLNLKNSVNWNADYVSLPDSFENPSDSCADNAVLKIYQVLKTANIQYEVIDIEPVNVQKDYDPAGYTLDAIAYITRKENKKNLYSRLGVGFKKDITTAYNAIKFVSGKSDYIGRLFKDFVSDDYTPDFKYDGYIRKPINDVITKDDVLRAMDAIEEFTASHFGHSYYDIIKEAESNDDTRLAAFAEAMLSSCKYRVHSSTPVYSVKFDRTSCDMSQLFVDYVNYIYELNAIRNDGSGIEYSCNCYDRYYDYRTNTLNLPFTRDDAIAFSVMICAGRERLSFVKITDFDESKIIDV